MASTDPLLQLRFETAVVHWRGPSPYFFVRLPASCAARVANAARAVSYGWGMVPVEAAIRKVAFRTALFPKEGSYLLPLKDAVRRKADIVLGDLVTVELIIHAVRRASHGA